MPWPKGKKFSKEHIDKMAAVVVPRNPACAPDMALELQLVTAREAA